MKICKLTLVVVGLALSTLLFNSCLGDDDSYSMDKYWIDLVTIVPINETTYYLRMDDGTTLFPAATNSPGYTPKDRQRAMVNFTLLSDAFEDYDHLVKVNRIDDVLTKGIAENKGDENDSVYGTDPVEMVRMWTGDNFLNVYFKALFGGVEAHFINLIPSEEENVSFEFRHNAYNDPAIARNGGLVVFDLSSMPIEEIEGKDTIPLTIKVKTYDGDQLYTINYVPSATDSRSTGDFGDFSFGELK